MAQNLLIALLWLGVAAGVPVIQEEIGAGAVLILVGVCSAFGILFWFAAKFWFR
jgi:hypothetical protein